MLGYQSINDAWQIKEKFTQDKPKEDCCNIVNRILSCEKCLKKLKEKLDSMDTKTNNIDEIIQQKVEQFTSKSNNISNMVIEKFSNLTNDNILLIIILVLLFLLVLRK